MNASIPARGLRVLCAASALTLLVAPGLAQDTIGDGFAETASQPTPVAFASYDTLPSGERVVFDGQNIDLYDAAGVFVMNLATLPGFVFNSFVEADPSSTFAIVGESSNGDVFRVALDGSGYTTLATLVFNYDAVFEDANHVLVSAATCGGFNCGNDIVRLDTTTGATDFLAHVDGPSGPVALADDGSLFYATVDTTIPDNTDIISWTQAQLNSGSSLDESDASVLHAGLRAAASLEICPEYGNVFLAESVFGDTSRILEFDADSGDQVDVVVESLSYLTKIELVEDAGIGHFHAYQPADGVFMHYNNGDIVTVRPQRPVASISQIGSAVTVTVTGAKPNAAMLVVYTPLNFYEPNSVTTILGGTGFQFHAMTSPLSRLRRSGPFYQPTDATGTGSFSYFDPGNIAGTLAFQALIMDESGTPIGSSDSLLN